MERIGVIVGNGKLPYSFLKEAEKQNSEIEVFPIGLFDTIEEEIKKYKNFKRFNIGEVGNITKYLILNGIKKVVMIGKVEKEVIFQDMQLDKYGEEIVTVFRTKKMKLSFLPLLHFLDLME